MMKIRFCEHNKGKNKVVKRLHEQFPKLDVRIKDCVGKCGPCHKTPFALVDGKTICGIDSEDLYGKIVKEMGK
ncbi:YuzB family protein [Geobacter sulfurreducens]|jgi:uncharacterized protein YuzB (UPF0349 family)|uniref:DUF1450 domain-containing protein n=2 Tax=Geobacter sulfurreducens TaxID=35554 RepID=Q74DK8_GEOSL|nr:DUF1450 domain-containing protein [Geobacter sulfurreducens]AAR34684.1 protein of unknown function DUF1450 [Geobacter sulfurreducens PCA]AJY71015.1 hypothetical protein RW64_16240 [Geobacter sulfurreducens]UAC05334.1 YuzB family protein [Geobacter sulfurreducens]UTG93970.1 DUF1450 domain-containing protein [Geobacter sulfurreducens]HBB69518.1 DUF1450 domain-containing protein [Geobacter sulfurreducens]